jgi:hypothetical protein
MGKTRSAPRRDPVGDFSMLEKKPGVIVINSATRYPGLGKVLSRDRTLALSGYTVTHAGPDRVILTQAGLSRQLSAAKARYYIRITETTSEAYKGMDKFYREYRRDSLVRGCINTLAFWATKESFDTVIESPKPLPDDAAAQAFAQHYASLKEFIDRMNTRVNLDSVLRVAIVKAKIWGKAPFEIEMDKAGKEPTRLIPLKPTDVVPWLDDSWNLTDFMYRGQRHFYKPSELLYFVNNPLEADYEGLSDIEPILDDVEIRGKIRREDLKEAATTLWAGVAIHSLDVDRLPQGLTQEDVQKIIDDHIEALRPGKHIATDNRWQITVVDLKPDLSKLVEIKRDMDAEVIGNFGVPASLLNRAERRTLATPARLPELEAFVDGPITDIQRWLKRDIEIQWYNRLAHLSLKIPEEQELPVRVVHKWRQIRTSDFFQLMDSATKAYGNGTGWIDQKKAYEIMRDAQSTDFDPNNLPATSGQPKPFELPLDVIARPRKPGDQTTQTVAVPPEQVVP